MRSSCSVILLISIKAKPEPVATAREAEAEDAGIYLLTPPTIRNLSAFAIELEAALAAAPVACLQLRLKPAPRDQVLEAGRILMPLCHRYDTAFLVNDSAEIAAELGADGVHLGQSDGDVATARRRLGHDREIGVTCHDSMHLAFEAGEAGADYVAFGAFYSSPTKAPARRAEPELLTRWAEIAELPAVAIGGISAENAPALARAGADFVAVSSYVWSHPSGPAAAITALAAALKVGA